MYFEESNCILTSAAGIFEIQKQNHKVSYPSHDKDDPSVTREGQNQEIAYPSPGWMGHSIPVMNATFYGHQMTFYGRHTGFNGLEVATLHFMGAMRRFINVAFYGRHTP